MLAHMGDEKEKRVLDSHAGIFPVHSVIYIIIVTQYNYCIHNTTTIKNMSNKTVIIVKL